MTCNLRHHFQHLQSFHRSSSPIFQPLYLQLDPLISVVIIVIIVIHVDIVIIIIGDTKQPVAPVHCWHTIHLHITMAQHPSRQRCSNTLLAHTQQWLKALQCQLLLQGCSALHYHASNTTSCSKPCKTKMEDGKFLRSRLNSPQVVTHRRPHARAEPQAANHFTASHCNQPRHKSCRITPPRQQSCKHLK